MNIYVDESHAWAKYAPKNTVDTKFLIAQTKERIAKATKRPLWIFDIDSTLLCVSDRFQHIFYDYLRFAHPGPVSESLWAVARSLGPDKHRYGNELSFRPILGAEPARELAEKMNAFWLERFFSERYLDKDFAYPGAVDFVNTLHSMGADIAYLTGRDAKTMTRGTRESMRALGFPLDNDKSFLLMKANHDESDVGYKHRYLAHLNRCFDVIGFVDNEPENVHAQILVNSEALAVWFHSISSDRIPALGPSQEKHLRVMSFFDR